jgi:predicted nucleotidyltransferase
MNHNRNTVHISKAHRCENLEYTIPVSLQVLLVYLSSMKNGVLNKKNIYEKLEKNTAALRHFGVRQIGLFGSFVRDEGTIESDIDLLVDFEPGKKTFKNFMDLSFFLEELFQRKVELLTRQGLSPYIGPYILKTVENVPLAS